MITLIPVTGYHFTMIFRVWFEAQMSGNSLIVIGGHKERCKYCEIGDYNLQTYYLELYPESTDAIRATAKREDFSIVKMKL